MSTTPLDPSTFTCWREPQHTNINQSIFGWPFCVTCKAAPPYHERPKYLVPGFALGLYVPKDWRANSIIAERSAVVGLPGHAGDDPADESDWISVSYEGWINGPMQYGDLDARGLWEAGVLHAANRLVIDYPTIARAHLPSSSLRYVGLYWPVTRRMQLDDEQALETWLA